LHAIVKIQQTYSIKNIYLVDQ